MGGLKFLAFVIFAQAIFIIQESNCQYSGESEQAIFWAPFVATSAADGTQLSQEDYTYAPAEETSGEFQKHKRSFGSIFKPSYSHLVQQHAKESSLTHRPPRPGEFTAIRGKKSFFPTWYSSGRRFYPRKKMYIHRPKESQVDESIER